MDQHALYSQLLQQARRTAEFAYRPYSNYNVGAAVLTFDNKMYVGCNVENYGFSQTVHAEEVAVCNAIADGALRRALDQKLNLNQFIKAIAVWAGKSNPAMPCFNCRQFLSEFGCEFDVVVEAENHQLLIVRFAELAPNPFSRDVVLSSTHAATVVS